MIYLIRHGQSILNVERRITCRKLEGDLTELGRQQAAKAAHWLADKDITRISASPFHRAQQTASIIADTLRLTPETDDDLREIDCGDLEHDTGAEVHDRWRAQAARWRRGEWNAAFPGGESLQQGYDRLLRALRRAGHDEDVLYVTHGGILVNVLPYLCVNAAALQQITVLEHTGIVILDYYDARRFYCVSFGLVEHLA